jgi:hypothetical protein
MAAAVEAEENNKDGYTAADTFFSHAPPTKSTYGAFSREVVGSIIGDPRSGDGVLFVFPHTPNAPIRRGLRRNRSNQRLAQPSTR